jgi:D-threo-aldose 1-dehydrogenase
MKASAPASLNARTSRPVKLTAMGFGSAPLGNLFRAIPEPEAQATLDAAWDAGIRYLDTAPQYGLGLSEMRIGAALGRWGREAATLSTKVGRLLLDCAPEEVTAGPFVDTPQKRIVFDYTYDGVMRSYESSRARLGRGADILLVHDVDAWTHGNSIEVRDAKIRELFDGGGFRALSELRASGEVGAIGAGVNEWQACEILLGLGDFDGFLLAGRYTLLEQEALESFLPLCTRRDVGIILGGPYNSGILATGPVKGAKFQYADAPQPILDRVARIEAVCRAHGVRLIEAALQFPMHHPAVKTVIPGAMTPGEVQANVAVFAATIPDSLWSDLKAEGLIRPDAPVPGG